MWYYKNKLFNKDDYPDAKGFIYKVTYLGKGKFLNYYYVGQKAFLHKKTTNLSKKQLEQRIDKRKSKKKIDFKDSGWQTYIGSCTNEDFKSLVITNKKEFKKEILHIVNKKLDFSINYYEKKYLILEDWESDMCWNGNFEGKVFKKSILNAK